MPRCYPPEPVWPPERPGERAVFDALRAQLPDEWSLFSSVGLTERCEEREIDILVAWPGHGLAAIEVKGGTVSHEQRQWWQASGNQKHKIQNPVTQAQDAKHALLRFIGRSSPALRSVKAAHLVAFPYTSISANWTAPDCPRDMALGKGELPKAAEAVLRAIDSQGKGREVLDTAGCLALESALEGALPGQ